LEYDGLCFPPNGTLYDKDVIECELNAHIHSTTGMEITFKFKGYGSSVNHLLVSKRKDCVVPEIIALEDNGKVVAVDESNLIYEKLLVDFKKVILKLSMIASI
jgi:hypothetical protein